MSPRSNDCRSTAAIFIACLAASFAGAADVPSAAKPRTVILCQDCGVVQNIRQIEEPIAPKREILPSITSSPRVGGMGSTTQPVPLLTFGSGGPHRVQAEPVTRRVWETTIRYDNGQYGFLKHGSEPDYQVGDRVRVVENVIELLGQQAR